MANSYTFQIIDPGNFLSVAIKSAIAVDAQYVIGLVGRYISWNGILDFAVEIRPASDLTWSDADGLLPSIAQLSWSGNGWTNNTITEATTGFDPDPNRPDAGLTIYLADDGTVRNYGAPVWFDPNPGFEINPSIPAGSHDFVGILTHEIFHSLGFINYTQEWGARMVGAGAVSYFTGAQSSALYGGAIPFQTGSDHYGYAQDTSIPINRGLMYQFGNYQHNRWDIGRIDLAMLADLGYTIKTYDGLSLFEMIDTATSLDGTSGKDTLYGDYHSNVINGLGGDDWIEGGSGDDQVDGGDGNDVLDGGAGNDVVSGGYGDDTAYVTGGTTAADTGSDTVDLGFNLPGPGGGQEAGADHLIVDYSGIAEAVQFAGFGPSHGPAGASATIQVGGVDRLSFSGVGRLTLTTGSGGDLVYGIGREDVISTGAGNDIIHAFDNPAGGRHRIDGGIGIDVAFRVNWSDLEVAVLLDLNDPQGVTIGSGAGERYLRGLEAIVGFTSGSGNDVVILGSDGALNNLVSTGLGSDTVVLFGGATYVSTGQVAVNLGSGPGTDELIADFGAATESVYFQSEFSGGTVTIGGVQRHGYSGAERLFLQTGSADDTVDGRDGGTVAFGFSTGAGNDLLYGGALDDELQGGIGNDRLEGGAGHDRLYGDGGNDQLLGGAGNDWLSVEGPGTATVEGGGDTDTLTVVYEEATTAITMSAPAIDPNGGFAGTLGDGGGHAVTYSGIERFAVLTGSGNDVVRGGTGDDYFGLGAGNDLLHLSGGSDYGDGGAGIDGISGTLAGSASVVWNLVTGVLGTSPSPYSGFEYFASLTTGSGQDHITTANVNAGDSLILGANNDSAILWNGHDSVNGGAAGAGATDSGLDTLILNYGQSTSGVHNVGALTSDAAGYSGQYGDDGTRLATFEAIDRFLIATGAGADSIATGNGNDEIRTGGGNDVVNSGGGNDLIDGGSGDDSMTGGTGNDVYVVSSAGDVVIENSGEGSDEVRTALATYVLAANLETLTGISAGSQDLRGNGGDNVVTGGAGADVLRLHDGGDDVVTAGAGNDNIFFIGSLTAADVVNGGEGGDTLVLQGPYGSLSLTANVTGIEHISILAGSNTVFGGSSTDRYDYVLTTVDANFAAGVQARINGAALLAGEDFTFDGSAETDALFVVYGGKGKDTLTGGLGNDIFFYAEERFANGDTVNGGSGYDGMFLRGNYTIDFNAPGYTGLFTSIENLTLTSATDERYARGGGTEFDYNLVLSDAIVGAGQQLTVSGALLLATETMIFDASAETDGTLRLFGGKASDTLKGGALADLIHGNLGADTLAGGGGADAFRFQNIAESNAASMDQILDFMTGTDKIELDRIDANSLVAGNQAFSWIGSSAFTGSAGQLRAYEQGGSWFVEGDVNGDGAADLVIALTLQGAVPLGAGDFLL